MRWIALLALAPAAAAADDGRLDLRPIPDLAILESIYHLDRFQERTHRSKSGILSVVGVGFGSHHGEKGLVGEGSLQIGQRMKSLVFAASSDIVAGGNTFVRGVHRGFLELRTGEDDEDTSVILKATAGLEHGEARGLAPVYLGPGKREHVAGEVEALIQLAEDKDDMMVSALVEVDGSSTHWLDAPSLDHATRGALGLGVVFAPMDDEIPRGRFDLLRGRVEHANLARTLDGSGVAIRDGQVRTIEVMCGVHELTFHIDHELLISTSESLGVKWIEAETARGNEISSPFFVMDLSIHMKWRKSIRALRDLGFALAREPAATPDGNHLASDWRLEIASGMEDARWLLNVRGGVSWVEHKDGQGNPETLKRYGSHIEAFAKIKWGVELGAYHVMTYEPQVAGDPWSSPRAWSTEAGLMARLRSNGI